MEYVPLGPTGTKVSELCLGTWRFGHESGGVIETSREEAHGLLDAAYEEGINFIDTSNNYGGGESERYIGEWLDGRDREEFVIASKVYYTAESRFDRNLSRKTIRAEIEGTLDRLGTEYLDVYYIHRFDDETPIAETLGALDDLVCEGLINHIGASTTRERNGAGWKLTKALWTSDAHGLEPFTVTQPKLNAAHRESARGMLDVAADQGLAVCPYEPLEGGFLTGKYTREGRPEGSRGALNDWTDDRFDDDQWRSLEAVESVAEEVGATPAQVSLRWLMGHDRFTCVPIVGARTPEQLRENLAATELSLTDDQHERITDAY